PDLVLRNCIGVVGEVSKKMPEVLLLAPFNEGACNVHVSVHAEMPIRDLWVDISRIVQSKERRLNRRERQGSFACHVCKGHRRRAAQIVTQDMETFRSLGLGEFEHILRDRGRQITSIGLVAIGVSAQVWRDKAVLVRKNLEEWHELTVVLRPPM